MERRRTAEASKEGEFGVVKEKENVSEKLFMIVNMGNVSQMAKDVD